MPPSTKRRTSKHELLVRDMAVTGVRVCVSVTAQRTPDSMPHQAANSRILVVGELSEPFCDQQRAELRIYETDAQLGNKDPPAFGVIVVGDGLARIGAFLRREHWADAWTIATAGALRFCRICFTAPTRGQGVVTRLDLSNDRIED